MTRANENSEGDSKLSEERLYAEAKENADTPLASPPLAPGSLTLLMEGDCPLFQHHMAATERQGGAPALARPTGYQHVPRLRALLRSQMA